MQADNPKERNPADPPASEDEELERVPDNVGQSGRWRRKDQGARSRYSNEEGTHSTEQVGRRRMQKIRRQIDDEGRRT